MQIPCCCFGIEKAPAGTMVTTPAVLMELPPKSPWRSGFPGHAHKGFYGLTIPGYGKNLPLCIVDPQGEAVVCHESHLRLVRTVYRRQTISWKERVLHTSGGFQDPRRVYASPAGSLHRGTDEQCPERLSKGLGAISCKNEFDKMVCPGRGSQSRLNHKNRLEDPLHKTGNSSFRGDGTILW